MQLQCVERGGATGRHTFALYARPSHAPGEASGSGTRAAASRARVRACGRLVRLAAAAAEPVALDGLYERLEAIGLGYHAAFRGLRAVYRRGDELYAEVCLEGEHELPQFALHPALLDAALHALLAEDPSQAVLPFSWNGVSVSQRAATALRVRLRARRASTGDSLAIADGHG